MKTENRRSFVKKSLATSMTITFSGLIRAHGGEGGETTTANPDETTSETTDSGGTTTWNPDIATIATTLPEETTWNPDESTVPPSTEETTIETTAPKYEIWGSPRGEIGSSDGYSEIVKQFGVSGYFLKLKIWCNPDPKSFRNVSLTASGELYGHSKLFNTSDTLLEFFGSKDSDESFEFSEGQPTLTNSTSGLNKDWTTGKSDLGNLKKYEITLALNGTRNDPIFQQFPPQYTVDLKLTGILKEYAPGESDWDLIDSASEEISSSLELAIYPEYI